MDGWMRDEFDRCILSVNVGKLNQANNDYVQMKLEQMEIDWTTKAEINRASSKPPDRSPTRFPTNQRDDFSSHHSNSN